MENIDEREITAARFVRRAREIWRLLTPQSAEDGLRLTALLLFTALLQEGEEAPWAWGDLDLVQRLPKVFSQAHDWFQLSDPKDGDRWRQVPQKALDELRALVGREKESFLLLRHLDYVVQETGLMRNPSASNRRQESFVADFAKGWVWRDEGIADLNAFTNGELGVRLASGNSPAQYAIRRDLEPPRLELCLRLHAHGVRFRFIPDSRGGDPWPGIRTAFWFPRPGRSSSARLSSGELPWAGSGLEFAAWLSRTSKVVSVAAIVLPTADLRAKGWRISMRRDLLQRGHVVGVVEMPLRVSGAARLSVLVIRTGDVTPTMQPVLLLNGRAVDGLRDEPLDRLAHFLSLPFTSILEGNPRGFASPAHDLGEALESRARKMFGANASEMPGLFRYVFPGEIFDSRDVVLDPAHWVPEREALVSSDILDGSPVHRLLTPERRACCVYVIGNNGAGKSMLLRQLAQACTASGRSVRAIASAPTDRFDTSVGAERDYVYLGSRTSDTATQPRKLGRKLAELIQAIYENGDRIVTFDRVLEQLSFSGRHFLLPESASSDLLESVRELGRDKSPDTLSGWKLGFQKLGTSSIVPFDHLSTGEQQVLLLTARLVAHAAPGVVFLVDEPETSLHVAWQRALPQVFQTISRGSSCQMVIATHSPVLISTAHGEDTFRFMADGGVLEEIGDRASSSVERVLFQGFDTYTGNNREVHERCAELVSRAIELVNTSRGEALPEVLDELRQMEAKVDRSVPALGSEATALHRALIQRALVAVQELGRLPEHVDRTL